MEFVWWGERWKEGSDGDDGRAGGGGGSSGSEIFRLGGIKQRLEYSQPVSKKAADQKNYHEKSDLEEWMIDILLTRKLPGFPREDCGCLVDCNTSIGELKLTTSFSVSNWNVPNYFRLPHISIISESGVLREYEGGLGCQELPQFE